MVPAVALLVIAGLLVVALPVEATELLAAEVNGHGREGTETQSKPR